MGWYRLFLLLSPRLSIKLEQDRTVSLSFARHQHLPPTLCPLSVSWRRRPSVPTPIHLLCALYWTGKSRAIMDLKSLLTILILETLASPWATPPPTFWEIFFQKQRTGECEGQGSQALRTHQHWAYRPSKFLRANEWILSRILSILNITFVIYLRLLNANIAVTLYCFRVYESITNLHSFTLRFKSVAPSCSFGNRFSLHFYCDSYPSVDTLCPAHVLAHLWGRAPLSSWFPKSRQSITKSLWYSFYLGFHKLPEKV